MDPEPPAGDTVTMAETAAQVARTASPQGRGWASLGRLLVLIAGICLAALGLLGGSLGVLLGWLGSPDNRLLAVTASISFLTVATGLGCALAWHAWRSRQGRESRLFAPRHLAIWIVAFVLALILGQTVVSFDLAPTVSLPPLHLLAAGLPPLLVLALVARSLKGSARWRDVVLQLSSGAILSTTLAALIELGAVVVLLLVALVALLVVPGGAEQLQQLSTNVQDPGWAQGPDSLRSFARSPWIAGAVLLIVSVVAPLVEESGKAVGIPLMAYRRPRRDQAYLWGLAGGAGFALAEGLLNSLAGLQAWGLAVLVRVAGTLLHCLNGGIMGLAWHSVLAERRWARALLLFFGAVSLHGAWNAASAGSTLLTLAWAEPEGRGPEAAFRLLAILGLYGLLVLLCAGVVAGLVLLTKRMQTGHRAAQGRADLR